MILSGNLMDVLKLTILQSSHFLSFFLSENWKNPNYNLVNQHLKHGNIS